jgi:branched-chain amino acid transport system permease protein
MLGSIMTTVLFFNLLLNGLIQGFIIGLAALALNMVFAVARFPNAATGDIMTAGAYAGIAAQGLGIASTVLQFVVAILAGVAICLAMYGLVFRKLQGRSLLAAMLASIGIAFVIRAAIFLLAGPEQQVFQIPLERAVLVHGVALQPNTLRLGLTALACMAVVFMVLHLTPIGRRMRAVADNPTLARAGGIRIGRVMMAMWAMAGAVCGVAGMVLGINTVVLPEAGWNVLLPAFAAAVLGGVGSPVGAIVAGVALGVAQELSTPFVGFTYKIALSFVVLIVILAVRPRGLFGAASRVR